MKDGIHPDGYVARRTQTNADRIRSMTDEELAEVLFGSCIEHMGVEECSHPEKACKSCVLDWLKAESEEKEKQKARKQHGKINRKESIMD